jgi:ligand-binding sensor domain-containing protein
LPAGGSELRYVADLVVGDSDHLWIAHEKGLAGFADGRFILDAGPPDVSLGAARALLVDRQRRLWVGTDHGLWRCDEAGWQQVSESAGLQLVQVDVMLEDRAGVLWFGSASPTHGGLASFDGQTWRSYGTADGLAHASVNALLEDPDGSLWIGTGFSSYGGLTRRTTAGWETLRKADGLAGEKVRSLYRDRQGRLWVGSEYDGIAVRDGVSWRVLTPRDGLAGWEVKEMLQDADGVYWLGTESGLSRLDPSQGRLWTNQDTEGKP